MPKPRADTRERIVTGAIDAVGMVGLRHLTMDDVARTAGLTRATLYKHFTGKEQVLEAAMISELRRVLNEVETVIANAPDGEAGIVEGFVAATGLLTGHQVIAHLMRTEPEALLPHLTGTSPVAAAAQAWAAGQIRAAVPANRRRISPERGGELLMRIVHSVTFIDSGAYDLTDPDQARQLARDWLVPAIIGAPS